MRLLKLAGLFLLAGCGQQDTRSPGNATAAAIIPARSPPAIEESAASKQSRVAKAYEDIQSASYAQYPPYVRYWAKNADGNDALCFGGNGGMDTTRENCRQRDGSIALLKRAGWCRTGSFGAKEAPTWRQCGPARPELLKVSDPLEKPSAASGPDNSPALDENGKPTTWNSASHAWEEN